MAHFNAKDIAAFSRSQRESARSFCAKDMAQAHYKKTFFLQDRKRKVVGGVLVIGMIE